MLRTGQHPCCAAEGGKAVGPKSTAASTSSRRIGWRIFGLFKTLTPAAVLVLLPKCLLCIVGYAAAAGIGLSISAAENLRSVVLWSCLGLLAFFATRQIYLLRRLRGRST